MKMQDIINQAKNNIWQAIEDYGKHTDQVMVLEDISEEFVSRLAEDSSYAKQGLRNLFSKSPAWHPELDAIIINGTQTHDPDYDRIWSLAHAILTKPMEGADLTKFVQIKHAIQFFTNPSNKEVQELGIQAINALAPNAYQPGKKLSRVFKALCVELGVADEIAGSEFQRLYAQIADELSSRKIDFKLFVSINPAHFLTMSNPKSDQRGSCLVSCHSLNSTEYEYNCGCVGYARDNVSFIVFTVDDPDVAETLNNRKTTRQIFAYKPGNGILLQSRMYNTSGGVDGQCEISKLYRDLIQREISMLEDQLNLWRTYESTSDFGYSLVNKGEGFGGYDDWVHEGFGGKVCVRFDHLKDGELYDCVPLEVGTYGLCVECGEEIDSDMYCYSCNSEESEGAGYCEECGDVVDDNDDLYTVYDSGGDDLRVCRDCLQRYYTKCDHCGRYHINLVMENIHGWDVCPECFQEHYSKCEKCNQYENEDDLFLVIDEDGYEAYVCDDCLHEHYETCEDCQCFVHENQMCNTYDADGDKIHVCQQCYETHNYVKYEETYGEQEAVQ